MKRQLLLMTVFGIGVSFLFSSCKSRGGGNGPEKPIGKNGPEDIKTKLPDRPPGSNLERGKFEHVFFAYDSSAINPHEGPKLDTVANFLKTDATSVILVEGHCDERGTAEYNRALGERRALAAREALIARGADGARLQTISYGKDRPLDLAHTDAALSKNRRAEFVIVRP